MTKLICSAIALATVLATAATARAHEGRIVVLKRTLAYRTAELGTREGAHALLKRVDGLALRMCRGQRRSAFDRPVASEILTCRSKSVGRAVAELDAPLVTAAHAEGTDARLASR